MNFKHVCITGGAGFVGSNLAILLKQAHPDLCITVLDNLVRRGSELALRRLGASGIQFVHGDIRNPEDLAALPDFDLLIDCSAEPSVQAGVGESPMYVLNTNLSGTINCLEAARLRTAAFLFLSTSRVYPIKTLNQAQYTEEATRFSWTAQQTLPGISDQGVSEEFPLEGPRSFYGASKLACELLIQEFVYNYNMPALINRCGVLAGPWQMAKADQGIVTLWLARHYFKNPLKYIGFGGTGKQVRDFLHIEDLFHLVELQLDQMDTWDGRIYNVGGGLPVSTSLCELTEKCQALTGNTIPITPEPATSDVDVRVFITDAGKVSNDYQWKPERDVNKTLADIHQWLVENEALLQPVLG